MHSVGNVQQLDYRNRVIRIPERRQPLYTYRIDLTYTADVFVSMSDDGPTDEALAQAVIRYIQENGLNGMVSHA